MGFTAYDSACYAIHVALQVHKDLDMANGVCALLLSCKWGDQSMAPRDVAEILRGCGLQVAEINTDADRCAYLVAEAMGEGYLTLFEVHPQKHSSERRWAVTMRYKDRKLDWAECVDEGEYRSSPPNVRAIMTGRAVQIRHPLSGNFSIAAKLASPFKLPSNN